MQSQTSPDYAYRAPDDGSQTGQKRKRTTYSCQSCRKKKIKCNNARPCNNCQAGPSKCIYDTDTMHNHATRDSDRDQAFNARDRLQGLEHKVDLMLEAVHAPRQDNPFRSDSRYSDSASPAMTSATVDTGRSLEPELKTRMQNLDVFAWPAMRPFLTTNEISRTTQGNFLISYESRTSDALSRDISEVTDGRIIDTLIGIFFRQVHIKHPLFEMDFARRCREQHYVIGHDLLGATVSIMMALGALVAEGPFSHLRDLQEQTIAMADRRIQTFLLGMTMDHARVIYLYGMLQLYRLRPWPYIQMVSLAASRLALMHSFGTRSSEKAGDYQSEQRLYWSCSKGEEEVQFIWGNYRPILPLDQTFESSFPPPPEGSYDPYGLNEESWFYYLSEIAAHKISRRVGGLVADQIGGLQILPAETILRQREDLAMQLQSWYESLPRFLQFSLDLMTEVKDNIDTIPHMRSYYFLSFAQHATVIVYHALHDHLDERYNECLSIAINDLRQALVMYSIPDLQRLHFGTYFMMHYAVDLACVMLLCLHSPRFVGLIEPAAQDEATRAMDNLTIFMQQTPGLRKGAEIFHRLQSELSAPR